VTGQGHGADSGQIRTAAVVIIAAFVLWMAGQAIGGALGLPVRYAFLIDLACMAAMVWALIVLLRVWRARQN
jgi:Na+/citrate or Na+/malate symporter